MGMIVYPGVPKFVSVTISAGQSSGSTAHNLGAVPKVGHPNPNKADGLLAYATADDTNVTVTVDSPVTTDTVFTVLCIV